VCIQSEVKPLVPPRRRHQRRKSNQVFLYGVVIPQGSEQCRGYGGGKLHFFEMYLVVKPHVPQALKNKVENIGVCIEIVKLRPLYHLEEGIKQESRKKYFCMV